MTGWRRKLRRRLLVNLKSGTTIAGVLFTARGGILELKDAELIDDAGGRRPVDGSLIVELKNVDYAQDVTPSEG